MSATKPAGPTDVARYMTDDIQRSIQVGIATSSPASPELWLTHKQTVSKHKEAGGQCIWVSQIDLISSLHGSGVRFCMLTRGYWVWLRARGGRAGKLYL